MLFLQVTINKNLRVPSILSYVPDRALGYVVNYCFDCTPAVLWKSHIEHTLVRKRCLNVMENPSDPIVLLHIFVLTFHS